MKKPFTFFSKLLPLAFAWGLGLSAEAQTNYSTVPLAASSFTADVVANGSAAAPPASSTTADVDGAGYYLISQDYYTATTAHTSGIPNNGAIANTIVGPAALTYQLASLSANNSLRLNGTASGTVTFATPTAANELYVLGVSGSAPSTVAMTVTYSDGTTTVFSGQTYPDWFTVSNTQNVFGTSARASATAPVSTTAATNNAPFLSQVKLIIPPAKATTTITSIGFANTGGVLNIMAVSKGTYPACTAPPTAGTAVASPTSLCATGTVTLSLSGVNAATGLTYQWQSSTTSPTTGFTNIAGATNSTYTAAVAQTTYYQAIVTCSGQSATSTPVTVTVTSAITYATVPYTQGFENTWLSRCNTNDAPDASWLNTPATGNTSWRREDDGSSASWTTAAGGAYSPTGSNANGASSSHSARFHNYFASNNMVGTLDLYVNLSAGRGTLKFDYHNADFNTVSVLLSTDGGATFAATPLQTLGNQNNWTSYTITLPTTVTATTVIRFRAVGSFGDDDTGIDNVSVTIPTPCTPTTATFSYPAASYCVNGTTAPTATLASGATAGTFTASPATGLTLNATTGAITLSSSTPGTYTVTNTVAATATNCASSATATVTIAAAPATPTLTTSGTAATGITLTSSAATGNQFYRNNVLIPGATGTSYLINSGSNNGLYTVTVTNTAGCSATSAAVAVTVTAATTAQVSTALTVAPNPTRDGLLTLELSGFREAVTLTVTNTLGQRVTESTVASTALGQKQTLNLSALPAGVYLLQARTASGAVEVRRIVRE